MSPSALRRHRSMFALRSLLYRPFGVKRFQTIHHNNVGVPRGFVLLFGIGTKALPSRDSKTRWNDLLGGLAIKRTAGPSDRANSPHQFVVQPLLGRLEPGFETMAFPDLRFDQHDPCCLHEQNAQVAIAALRYLAQDRAVSGRHLPRDEP